MIERALLITGGRDYLNHEFVNAKLSERKPDIILHGGARGADTLADQWAHHHGIPRIILSVPDHFWKKYGKSMGHRRNRKLASIGSQFFLDYSERNLEGMAFPGGNGTDGMCGIMDALGLYIWDYRHDPVALVGCRDAKR